jgi:hypothetical protein
MAVLAGGWSFLMPLCAWLAQRFDGAGFPKPPALIGLTEDSTDV